MMICQIWHCQCWTMQFFGQSNFFLFCSKKNTGFKQRILTVSLRTYCILDRKKLIRLKKIKLENPLASSIIGNSDSELYLWFLRSALKNCGIVSIKTVSFVFFWTTIDSVTGDNHYKLKKWSLTYWLMSIELIVHETLEMCVNAMNSTCISVCKIEKRACNFLFINNFDQRENVRWILISSLYKLSQFFLAESFFQFYCVLSIAQKGKLLSYVTIVQYTLCMRCYSAMNLLAFRFTRFKFYELNQFPYKPLLKTEVWKHL